MQHLLSIVSPPTTYTIAPVLANPTYPQRPSHYTALPRTTPHYLAPRAHPTPTPLGLARPLK